MLKEFSGKLWAAFFVEIINFAQNLVDVIIKVPNLPYFSKANYWYCYLKD